MAKKTSEPTKGTTGLPKANMQRYHYDIYAILEGSQEIYLGHETAVNVNLVETVRIAIKGEEVEKCYLSPTKRRGVERRMLIRAPMADGWLLGDKWGCGIPHTCAEPDCPICRIYGALITKDTVNQLGEFGNTENPKAEGEKIKDRPPRTYVGRLTHGGGVAIQAQEPSQKQRAMHPDILVRETPSDETKPTPMPFKREYNEPGLLYPIYNHALSVSQAEFNSAAYAFLQSLARLGAGNPKGMALYYSTALTGSLEPMIVVDKYLSPLGGRPVISPHITGVDEALERFALLAYTVQGEKKTGAYFEHERFERWLGNEALKILQTWADDFVQVMLK